MNTKKFIRGGEAPLWYRCLKHSLPVSAGLIMAFAGVSVSTAAEAMPNPSVAAVDANQQKHNVTGVVTDADGSPLVGVSVLIKGSNTTTTTNENGRYSIKASNGQTLVFSYIGYKRMEVKVSGATHNVSLESFDQSLNEAVVIGYGTVRKADLAGSVAVMDNKAFRDQPITQVSDALQGRIAGVQVVSSGVPGGDVKIRVRGTGSIYNSNDPLYVVDGIVRESGLDGINPEDIQSMQVLKDASSTAIYGSRGANGVVLVTTKTGKAGMTQVTFDAAIGFSKAYNIPEAMNAQEYASALLKYKYNGEISAAPELEPYINRTDPGVDWMDEILRTGMTQNYKLAFSKGNDDTQYYVSGNYMKHEGVITTSQYERYSFKANVHSKLYKWLELTADMNFSQGNGRGIGVGLDKDNPILKGLTYSPSMHIMTDDGLWANDPYNNIDPSPLGMIRGNKNDRKRTVTNGHVDLKFNIAKGLTFTTTNGLDYSDRKGYTFVTAKMVGGTGSSMSNSDNYRLMLQSSNNLTYSGKWDKHALTATAVWEATQNEDRSMGISGNNLTNEEVGYWDVNNAKTRGTSNGYSKWTLLSGVARVMYNFDDRYMLTGTFRADGSSRFTNDKWGYFPSVAAAWTVSREGFMQDVKDVVNDLKIRASYGIVGNQNISPYSTLGLMSSVLYNFGDASNYTGYWVNGIATPDLTWEKTKQFDFGVDMGFLNNRITLSFDYFNKRTTDALMRKTSPNYLGGVSYYVNAGEISNKGFDISLTARVFQSDNFSWTTTLNGTYLKNKVEKLVSDDPFIPGQRVMQGKIDYVTIAKEGEAIGAFYGYRWAGIGAKGTEFEGKDTYYKADGTLTDNPDSNTDRAVLGDANPDFTLGWNNTLSLGNWDLNMFFNASFGAQRLNLVRYAMNSQSANRFITGADFFEGVGKDYADLTVAGNKDYGNSSKWLEDADYLRLENITLAYNLPKSIAKVADFRFSFSVQNAFTITGYKGADPAGMAFGAGGVDMNPGVDIGSYPNPRTFTLGVRMNF